MIFRPHIQTRTGSAERGFSEERDPRGVRFPAGGRTAGGANTDRSQLQDRRSSVATGKGTSKSLLARTQMSAAAELARASNVARRRRSSAPDGPSRGAHRASVLCRVDVTRAPRARAQASRLHDATANLRWLSAAHVLPISATVRSFRHRYRGRRSRGRKRQPPPPFAIDPPPLGSRPLNPGIHGPLACGSLARPFATCHSSSRPGVERCRQD